MKGIFFLGALFFFARPANAFVVGLGQTFGSDNYSGTRLPLRLLDTPIEEDSKTRVQFEFQLDTYKDDLVPARFFSFEPKLRVVAPGEGSLMASVGWVPSTDSYGRLDFGIEIHYTVFQTPHSDLKSPALIEELGVGLSIRRRSHSDSIFTDRSSRGQALDLSETWIAAEVAFLHNDWNVLKPNIKFLLSKSFFSQALQATDRPNPMASIFSLSPFVQGYAGFSLSPSAYWNIGRPGGLTLEPKIFYTYASFDGMSQSGNAFGTSVRAEMNGYGVFANLEFYKLDLGTFRTFLSLGATVSF